MAAVDNIGLKRKVADGEGWPVSLFEAKYYDDAQIWELVHNLTRKRESLRGLLAKPEVSTDPDRFVGPAKKLARLEEICSLAQKLKEALRSYKEMEASFEREQDVEMKTLAEDYREESEQVAADLYHKLLTEGYLSREKEDEKDLAILRYLKKMGPEYPWRLGVNLGMEEKEARQRLKVLREKDLITRVKGTMLDNYHRQKGWTKHMNHTYYRLSRRGRLYLRRK